MVFLFNNRMALAVASFAILCAIGCNASSFTDPHSHEGKVTPFVPGAPDVTLDDNAKAILNSGEPYQTVMNAGESGKRDVIVQDIEAPTNMVWDKILDFDNYVNMVPTTTESEIYAVEENPKNAKDAQTIYQRMKVGFPLLNIEGFPDLKMEIFLKRLYYPTMNSMTWTLDYSKKSDFDDSCGYWYVVPHPDNKSWSRVFYAVEASMADWAPTFVTEYMSSKALVDATAWVKKYSETEYADYIITPKKRRMGPLGFLKKLFSKKKEVRSIAVTTSKVIDEVPVLMEITSGMEPTEDEVESEEVEVNEKVQVNIQSLEFLQLTLVCFGIVLTLTFSFVILFQILRTIGGWIF